MTPEDIKRMARDAGMHNDGQWWFDGDSNAQCDVSTAALARFAALVRAQALDEAARVCDKLAGEGRSWPDASEGSRANIRAVRLLADFAGTEFSAAIRALAGQPGA